ncbi:hypothetical protein J437_LFUL002508 [Ladona fulva]|uniref:C2H2-type domain-containing protein n=1 Tax=Ladona fulva TaxID=123851 RepID=A0A8K0PBN6_LADFU|nr:hypothetical protein J437_LFUL002508 [Ladona fulva]
MIFRVFISLLTKEETAYNLKMTSRNDINIKDHNCFICGNVIGIAHFPLSSARLEILQKSFLNELNHQIKQSLTEIAVDEEFLCHKCSALLDFVNDLESKLTDARSTLSSLYSQKFKNTLSTSKETGGACLRVGSCNSIERGSSYCKSSQNNSQVAELSTGESKGQDSHMMILEEEKSFCKFCSFSSNSEEMLKFHISAEHKEFVCCECHQVFGSSGEVDDHIKEKHLGKWACHVCDKVFFNKLTFTNHSRLHLKGLSEKSIEEVERKSGSLNLSSEKSASALENHQCNYCNYSTSFKNSFDDHIRSHVALKLFKCVSCGLLFESKALLNQHKRSHEKLMYVCGLCGRTFISRDLVINHLKERHKQSYSSEKSDLKEIKMKQEFNNHISDFNVRNCLENPSVSSYTSCKSNIYPKGAAISSVRKTEIVKKENPGATPSEDFTSVIRPQISKKETSRFSCNFVEGIESESLSENVHSIIEDNFIKLGRGSQIQENPSKVTDVASRILLRSNESNISAHQNCHSNSSSQKEDKVVDRSDAHLIPVFQNVLNPCNDESSFQTVDISSEDLIIQSGKEGSSTKYNEASCQLVKNKGNSFSENSISEVKLLEENENDKNGGFWISLSSLVDSENLNEPLEENLRIKEEKHSKLFICGKCGYKSFSAPEIIEHIASHTGGKSEKVLLGEGETSSISSHPYQVDTHQGADGFSRENLLNRHKRIAHSSSKCCFCTKTFPSMEELSEHKSKHEQEDGYQCLECPRIFKTKTGLKFHSAQHTGEYKFRCQYCDQGFMSRVVYQEHMGKHTKEERYICDVCGRKFCFQSTYWIHRKWHDTPFPYKCDICDRPFRHSSLLKVHKRQHTGERPYHCPHCSRSFSVSGTLKRHLMLHTGDYAFSCGECEKGFTTRNKFALHLSRVHGNDSLLQQGPPKTEFKMVIRDTPKSPKGVSQVVEGKVNEEDLVVENYEELDSMMVQDGGIVGDGADLLKESSLMLPCSILDDVSGSLETRVVEILVNDETSQAVATVTVEGNSSLHNATRLSSAEPAGLLPGGPRNMGLLANRVSRVTFRK